MGLFSTLTPAAQAGKPRLLQRACACAGKGPCPECAKKKRIQRKAVDGAPVGDRTRTAAADTAVASAFEASGGAPLAPAWRTRLEPAFGASFADVRIHDDAGSHVAARRLQARAFTVGQHVHFGAGQYGPGRDGGLHLLAHELSHTLQQRGASGGGDALEVDSPGSSLEVEADRAADAVLASNRAEVSVGRAGLGRQAQLQRAPAKDLSGSAERTIDANTKSVVTRGLAPAECRRVPETQSTPTHKIFEWDEEGRAIKLKYHVCNGRVQLDTGASLDYSDVHKAATDLLRKAVLNPVGAPDAIRDAVNGATITGQGFVSFTVDRTFDVTLSGGTTEGTQSQKTQVKVKMLFQPHGKVQVIAEAGASISKDVIAKEVEKFARAQLNLGDVSVEVKFVDKTVSPTGGPASNEQKTSVSGSVKVPVLGPVTGTVTVDNKTGEKTVTVNKTFNLDKPKPPKKVECYGCICKPPLPSYTCRRVEKEHPEEVPTQTHDFKTARLYYNYDTDVPNPDFPFDAGVSDIAAKLDAGYTVKRFEAYASPEANRSYNKQLAAKRGRHAAKQIRGKSAPTAAALPDAEAVGELRGESGKREGKEAFNAELAAEISRELKARKPDEQLAWLGVDETTRSNPDKRAAVLADIDAFISGKDAGGKVLTQRQQWEKVFPLLRRVELDLDRPAKSRIDTVPGSDKAAGCTQEDRDFIDKQLAPIPTEQRVPQEMCK